ncbi:MAG: single-stranded DNA-binding protein [Bacillota bacterium]|nr:single-stranded DNA-binding protein [Bacillota bacterium]
MEQKENRVVLRGTVAGAAEFSHRVHGIDFYRFPLAVPRLSGREDLVNILLSPGEAPLPQPGDYLEVTGQVRSFNNRSGVGNRLIITVLARSVVPGQGDPCNQVLLTGTLCKDPVLRRTPLGRDICDLLLAVNRKYRRADYLPCITWGRLALSCAQLRTGDSLALEGRLQSRTYLKTIGDQTQERTAFEISVSALELLDQEGEEEGPDDEPL